MCYSCWIRQDGRNPSGNTFLGKELTLWNDLWIYTFELVIRWSKVKLPFSFQLFTLSKSSGWTACRCPGPHLFQSCQGCSLKLQQHLVFWILLQQLTDRHDRHAFHERGSRQAHDFRCGLFLLMVSGEVQLCTQFRGWRRKLSIRLMWQPRALSLITKMHVLWMRQEVVVWI